MAPLANNSVVTVGKRSDHIVDLCGLTGSNDLSIGGIVSGVAKILGNGVVEQMWVLRHHANRTAQRIEREITNIVTIDTHRTFGDVVQTRHQRTHCRFARTRWTDECNQLPRKNRSRDIVKNLDTRAIVDRPAQPDFERSKRLFRARRIAEGDVIKLDRALGRGKIDCIFFVIERIAKIEDFKNAIEGNKCGHDVDTSARERGERFIDACHQCR